MSPFGPPDIEKLRARRNVKGLAKALDYEKDWAVALKVAAAEALGEIGDERAILPLVKTALTHDAGDWRTGSSKDEREVARAAARALLKIGPQAVAPLVEALGIIEVESSAVGGVHADAVRSLKKRYVKGADMRLKVVAHAAAALGEIEWGAAADHLARLEPALANLVSQMEGGRGPLSPQALAYGRQLDYVAVARSRVTRALEQIWGLPMAVNERELATTRRRARVAEAQAETQQELRKRAAMVTSAADAVVVLVELYDATGGEGFVTLSPAAEPVRQVGERLDEIGGIELMRDAHALFVGERPHLARNLEMVWDGIGTWSG